MGLVTGVLGNCTFPSLRQMRTSIATAQLNILHNHPYLFVGGLLTLHVVFDWTQALTTNYILKVAKNDVKMQTFEKRNSAIANLGTVTDNLRLLKYVNAVERAVMEAVVKPVLLAVIKEKDAAYWAAKNEGNEQQAVATTCCVGTPAVIAKNLWGRCCTYALSARDQECQDKVNQLIKSMPVMKIASIIEKRSDQLKWYKGEWAFWSLWRLCGGPSCKLLSVLSDCTDSLIGRSMTGGESIRLCFLTTFYVWFLVLAFSYCIYITRFDKFVGNRNRLLDTVVAEKVVNPWSVDSTYVDDDRYRPTPAIPWHFPGFASPDVAEATKMGIKKGDPIKFLRPGA